MYQVRIKKGKPWEIQIYNGRKDVAPSTALMKTLPERLPAVVRGKIWHQLINCNKQSLYTYFVTVPIILFFYLNQCFRHINGYHNYSKNLSMTCF